jgi:hypothetical protein
MIKKFLIGFFILFLVAQAVQPPKNQGNSSSAQDITTMVTVPPNVMNILKKSCYDCHSNHTVYPWYDNITPINWWVADHIKEGKRELNFTEFGSYSNKKQLNKLKEIGETVEEGQMPLSSYLITHGDASLTGEQKTLLIDWARKASDELVMNR